MSESGRTSVTPPPWWEQTGPARISALLAAARSGDEAAWSDLVGRIEPFLSSLVPGASIDSATGESIADELYARLSRELPGIDDEDSLISWMIRTVPRYTAGRYSEIDRSSLSRLSATEGRLFRLILRGESSYTEIASSLNMPVGAIGPAKRRLFRKIWGLSRPGLPTEEFDPRPDRGTPREDLEAALRVHRASHGGAPPKRENGWLHAVARTFGLVPPPWTRPPAGDDLVVAACRDVTGATRETLREVIAVAAERDAFRAGDR